MVPKGVIILSCAITANHGTRASMSWLNEDTFEVQPPLGWGVQALEWPKPVETPPPVWANDIDKKKLFGVELAKHSKPFDAACIIFPETIDALWVTNNWLSDPIVIAAKDAYNSVKKQELLDRDAFALKLLALADQNHNGIPLIDAKDRIAALKLYAEVQGFIGKTDINISGNTYNDNKVMKILLVKPDNQNQKTIEAEPESSDFEPIALPNIKLVSAS